MKGPSIGLPHPAENGGESVTAYIGQIAALLNESRGRPMRAMAAPMRLNSFRGDRKALERIVLDASRNQRHASAAGSKASSRLSRRIQRCR